VRDPCSTARLDLHPSARLLQRHHPLGNLPVLIRKHTLPEKGIANIPIYSQIHTILKRAVAGVCAHVPRQVAGGREGLAARLALVRAVAGVRPQVHRHVAGLREGLAARRALAVLVLCGSARPFLPGRTTLIFPGCMFGRGILPVALAADRHRGVVARGSLGLESFGCRQTGQNLRLISC